MSVSYRLHAFVCPAVTSSLQGWSALLVSVMVISLRIQCHMRTFFPRLCQPHFPTNITSALCFYLSMLTNITDIFCMVVALALVTMRCRSSLQKTMQSHVLQFSRDFVNISDHNHNCGAMMLIAIFTLMKVESIGLEQFLLSHQFNLSQSLYTLQGREDKIFKMHFSCHHEKDINLD